MNRLFHLSCVALLLSAAGCNDDASVQESGIPAGMPPATPLPPSPPPSQTVDCTATSFSPTAQVDALPGGVWVGTMDDCANNLRHEVVTAMISEDGRFRIIDDNEHLLAGEMQTTGDFFSGAGLDFAPAGVEYFSGPTTNLFVEGLIAERQNIEGRWGTEWGSYGYFTLEYVQQSYERATPLAELAGAWPSYATYRGMPVEGVWTIETDGQFSGQDDMGCLQTGQFSIIDDRYSIVAVQLTLTGCELVGSYSGLARLEDLVDWWDTAITVSVNDGARALRILLLD